MFLTIKNKDEGAKFKIYASILPPGEFTGCTSSCPLSEFKKLTKAAVPDDPVAECLGPRTSPTGNPCISAATTGEIDLHKARLCYALVYVSR